MNLEKKEFQYYKKGEKIYLPSFTSTSIYQVDWKGNTYIYISINNLDHCTKITNSVHPGEYGM
jgi:hypothetical protein